MSTSKIFWNKKRENKVQQKKKEGINCSRSILRFTHLSCIMLLNSFCTFICDPSMMRTCINRNYRVFVLKGKHLCKITLKEQYNQRCSYTGKKKWEVGGGTTFNPPLTTILLAISLPMFQFFQCPPLSTIGVAISLFRITKWQKYPPWDKKIETLGEGTLRKLKHWEVIAKTMVVRGGKKTQKKNPSFYQMRHK